MTGVRKSITRYIEIKRKQKIVIKLAKYFHF